MPDEPPTTDPPVEPPAPSEPKFTQQDLDKIAGEARSKGRTSAEKEFLEKLGVSNVDEAIAALTAAKEAEEAKKTESQRLTEENERLRAEAERATETAKRTIVATRVENALRDAGIKPERIPHAIKLANLEGVTVEGSEVTGVDEAVAAVKEASPEWFGSTAPPPQIGGTSTSTTALAPDQIDRLVAEKYGIHI